MEKQKHIILTSLFKKKSDFSGITSFFMSRFLKATAVAHPPRAKRIPLRFTACHSPPLRSLTSKVLILLGTRWAGPPGPPRGPPHRPLSLSKALFSRPD